MKDWYRARSAEGTTTKNINSMSVLYSVACLMEAEESEGGVYTAGGKDEYLGWIARVCGVGHARSFQVGSKPSTWIAELMPCQGRRLE